MLLLTYSWFSEWGFIDIDCHTNDGKTYQGKVNVTREGLNCKPWDTEGDYTYLGSLSYCRNPGQSDSDLVEDGPWCFADSDHTLWGYCDVRQCNKCDVGNDF